MRSSYVISLFLCVILHRPAFAQSDSIHQGVKIDYLINSRQMFMSTINNGEAKDDWTYGALGGVGAAVSYHKFTFRMEGLFWRNMVSSNLSERDPATGMVNRYETGLYDLQNLKAKEFARIGLMHLEYTGKKISATFGRFLLQTPFINTQDGRLVPNYVQGLKLQYPFNDALKAELIGINAMAPRSTSMWMGLRKSIGIYPSGQDIFSKPSTYADSTMTGGLAIAALHYEKNKWKADLWNYYLDNVMNTAAIFAEYKMITWHDKKDYLTLKGQFTLQHKLGNGGNHDIHYAYYQQSGTEVYSGRLEWGHRSFTTTANYTYIDSKGRFLFPREWGRDPFYTFLPRERNEGAAGVHAMMMNGEYKSTRSNLTQSIGVGYFNMPSANDGQLNKYRLPDYVQVNYALKYVFGGKWNVLNAFVLVAAKKNVDAKYTAAIYDYSKTNLIHFTGGLQLTMPAPPKPAYPRS